MPATQQGGVYQQLAGNSPALQTGHNGPPSHHDEGGTVEGTITPAQVLEQAAQGFDAEESDALFDILVRAFVLERPMRMCARLCSPLAKSVVRALVTMLTSLQMGCMRERLQ